MTQDLKTKLIQEAITKFRGRFGWLYKYMAEAKPLNPAYYTNNHGINMEDFLATEIGNAVEETEKRVREEMVEKLTEKLDLTKMLPGWQGHWVLAGGDRYIENCLECENAERIHSVTSQKENI